MAKHRLDEHHTNNTDHTEMKSIGNLIFAARVDGTTGVWRLAQGMWASELRRRPDSKHPVPN